jgi:glycosidase
MPLDKRPDSLSKVTYPQRESFHPSPVDWREEILYFLLPDRFSDEKTDGRTPLDLNNTPFPPNAPVPVQWDQWAHSGGGRWQGGTLKGLESRLAYLEELGVTAIWIGPVFKQRLHLNTYHGYGIQDFLEVDAHFGTREDLISVVSAAHKKNIRVILDIIFNHSAWNWNYEGNQSDPPYRPWPGYYKDIFWLDKTGNESAGALTDPNGAVWPIELQAPDAYTRAGKGSLGGENLDDVHAEFRRTDFDGSMRDFNFDREATLTDLARCYKYWIALTDCDGFRLDTLKHVGTGVARSFCGTIKEFASNLGKTNFFLVGEVGGPDMNAATYRSVLQSNLNATLDIGESRVALTGVAKGFRPASHYFDMVAQWDSSLGSHRDAGLHHVVVLDDHDHVFGSKVRFSTDAASLHQVVAGVAIQLFSLGIPCIYYGTEQSLAGPPLAQRQAYLPDFGSSDKYLRETMFGAEHPRKSGAAGLSATNPTDTGMPGFAAFGASSKHCFRTNFTTYQRIKALIHTRQRHPVLRFGRQYLRPIRKSGWFTNSGPGDIFAWSRILDEEEALVVVNGHGGSVSSAHVTVDAALNPRMRPGGVGAGVAKLRVVCNSAEQAGQPPHGTHAVGDQLTVKYEADGRAYVEIANMPPSGVLVLTNRLA